MNRSSKHFIPGTVLAATLAFALPMSACASPENDNKAEQTPASVMVETQTLQASTEARKIMQNVIEARLALFEGQTELAEKLIKEARGEFKHGLEKYAIKDGKLGHVIPLDSSVVFAEGFTPDENQKPSIQAAGEVMRNGDIAQAVSIMTKAGVKLDVSAVMMPVKPTMKSLDRALKDIKKGDFYAANLILKTIESSIEVNAFDSGTLPKQGYVFSDVL